MIKSIFFFFMLSVSCLRTHLTLGPKDFLYVIYKSFIILHFTFKPMMHFELILDKVYVEVYISNYRGPAAPPSAAEKALLFSFNYFVPFSISTKLLCSFYISWHSMGILKKTSNIFVYNCHILIIDISQAEFLYQIFWGDFLSCHVARGLQGGRGQVCSATCLSKQPFWSLWQPSTAESHKF